MINTYQDLLGLIEDFVADDEVGAQAPTFVQLAEKKFNKLLNTLDQETRATAVTEAGERYLAIPDDFSGARRVTLIIGEGRIGLEFDPLLDDNFGKTAAAQPQSYNVEGTEIAFGPIPDSAYDLEILFIRDLRPLSEENNTNFLLTVSPDLYLWQSLSIAEAWLNNDERAAMWEARAQTAMAELLKWDRGNRYPAQISTQHDYGQLRVRHG